jgi:hypothetical protein
MGLGAVTSRDCTKAMRGIKDCTVVLTIEHKDFRRHLIDGGVPKAVEIVVAFG